MSRPKYHGPVFVDAEDVPLVTGRRWQRIASGYLATNETAAEVRARGGRMKRTLLLHRLLTDAPAGMFVDHIDGDILNNSRANLRVCTRQQNQAKNRSARGVTGLRGVYPYGQKFMAMISLMHRSHFLGAFQTKEAAAHAYDAAAQQHFGEFAQVNYHRSTTTQA